MRVCSPQKQLFLGSKRGRVFKSECSGTGDTVGTGRSFGNCISSPLIGDWRGLNDSFIQRIAEFAPRRETTGQWPHAQDPLPSQEQRHTGAGGFARSSAVENDVPVAPKSVPDAVRSLSGRSAMRRATVCRSTAKSIALTQVHNLDLFTGIEHCLISSRRNSGRSELIAGNFYAECTSTRYRPVGCRRAEPAVMRRAAGRKGPLFRVVR